MGYWSDVVVAHKAMTQEEARVLAASTIAWLVDRRIIEDRQCEGCIGSGPCYAPGPDYLLACRNVQPGYGNSCYETFANSGMNGMRVVLGPDFILNGIDGFPPVPCPRCGAEVSDELYLEVGFRWLDGQAEALDCPHCKAASPLPEWRHATGGFVMLAFEFYYWPEFNPAFLGEFSRRLGCGISYVGAKK